MDSPRLFEFLENFWKISPSPGRKAVQMPPVQGELPDYCFNFSVASIMLLKLCMYTGLLDNTHLFTINVNGLKHLQIRNTACVGLWFSTNPPQIRDLFLWIHHSLTSPHYLRHDLSRNMTSRLAIKFPTPYEWWSISLPPGQEKTSNARGMPGGDVEASIWPVH